MTSNTDGNNQQTEEFVPQDRYYGPDEWSSLSREQRTRICDWRRQNADPTF